MTAMATSTSAGPDREAGKASDSISYLLDAANNMAVIFTASPVREGELAVEARRKPLGRDESSSAELRNWIMKCNSRIATLRPGPAAATTRTDARDALLATFPQGLQFAIGALFDFANRTGTFENPALAERIGLETQSLISGILCLHNHLKQQTPSQPAEGSQLPAYTSLESEATWSCYQDLIRLCSRKQQFDIALDAADSTLLPIPTLEIRLIVQNVIFSVLDGSYSAQPVAIRVANTVLGHQRQPYFSLAVRVNGSPLCAVLSRSRPEPQRGGRTFVFEGSGIGYLIAARLIGYLGGELRLEHVDADNSIVEVLIPLPRRDGATLPRADNLPATAAQQSAGTESCFSVLYIEDTRSHAMLVNQIVGRLGGFDLMLANTGENGLALAISKLPKLILLDMELPDMSGLALYRELQANPLTAAIPVFALSASAMPHQVSEALQLGIHHYLTKPFSYKELTRLLLEARSKGERNKSAA